jgi:hypothetical protein
MILAAGARPRSSKSCHPTTMFQTHETFTLLTPQCWNTISLRIKNCMSQLMSFWNVEAQRFKTTVKSAAVLQGRVYVDLYVSLMCLIGTKHSQPPQIVPHQRLHVQPFTTPSQTAWPSSSRQILPPQSPMISAALLSCRDRVGQEQDVTPGGHSRSIPAISCPHGCSSAPSQNADRGQHQVHTTATGLPSQVSRDSDCAQGNRDSSSQKIRRRRGRSPRRRGAKENALAVSPRPL